jgi:RNA polymerase sigma-70 factor (ECF subfamily)
VANRADMTENDFQNLVDRQYVPLFRFALSLSKSETEAADLTQQTFFLWATKGDQLRDRSKAKSWLFTTLYREFLSRRRHDARFPQVELDEAREDDVSILPNVEAIDGKALLHALQDVEEPFRASLTLFYLEQFSYQEIADVLEIPIGTVMSRLSRGKAQLRERLLSKGDTDARKIVSMAKEKRTETDG